MELSAPLRKAEDLGERVLKVNHAGENGAVNIYAGQIFCARLTAPDLIGELREFKGHEENHRRIFQAELERRGVRRCRSYVLCGIGGYTLGVLSGLFGRGAIVATTVAVERVVLGHLKQQLQQLAGKDELAVVAIQGIVSEEQQHHDQSATHAQANRLWLVLLGPLVALATELVIWTGMRL